MFNLFATASRRGTQREELKMGTGVVAAASAAVAAVVLVMRQITAKTV